MRAICSAVVMLYMAVVLMVILKSAVEQSQPLSSTWSNIIRSSQNWQRENFYYRPAHLFDRRAIFFFDDSTT